MLLRVKACFCCSFFAEMQELTERIAKFRQCLEILLRCFFRKMIHVKIISPHDTFFQAEVVAAHNRSRQVRETETVTGPSKVGYFSLLGGTSPFNRRYNARVAYCSLSWETFPHNMVKRDRFAGPAWSISVMLASVRPA